MSLMISELVNLGREILAELRRVATALEESNRLTVQLMHPIPDDD